MADEIVIGKLIIDTGALEASMASSKRSIIDLENEQKKLKKDTDNLTDANEDQLKAFINNENELKKLKSEYAANQKSVLELTKAQLGLDEALAKNIKLEGEAIANNKELIAARRAIDASTVEGAKAIETINTKIDANNKFINAGSSALEKQKANVGNYPQIMSNVGNAFGGATQKIIGFVQSGNDIISSFSEVAGAITASTSNIIGFGNSSKKAAEASKLLQTAQGGVGQSSATMASGTQAATGGMKALTTSSLAFIATPVGLVLLAIALVLGTLVAVFKNFQPLVDKLEQGMAALAAVFNVVKNTILAVLTGTKSLGDAFKGLGGDMADAAKRAAELTKAQQDLEDAQKSQEVITARNRAEINKLNVALKNRTLSEQERLKIADEIEKKEKADYAQRKALVDQEVKNAREAIAIKAQFTKEEIDQLKRVGDATKELAESRGGNYDEEYDALNKARLKAIALEDESTVNLEKNQNKREKLEDDAAAKRAARLAKQQAANEKALQQELKDAQNRIDILKLEAERDNLTTEQKIANAQKVFELQNALAQRGLSGTDEQKKLLENAQELSTNLLTIADAQINKEIEAQKRKFEATKAVNAEIYDEQTQNANLLAEAQIKLLNKNLLSERAYTEEVNKIYIARNEALSITQANFDAAEKVRREAEAANLKALEEVNFQIKLQDILDKDATEQEIKQMLRDAEYKKELEDLDKALRDQQLSREVYDAKRALAEKKYNSDTKKNDKILADQKKAQNLNILNDGLNALGQLFEGSKAVAVAQALVNTYQGISAGVALGYPAAIPAVAFAALSGFAAVRNILKTNKNSTAEGGGGTPQTTSGTASFVNTSQTDTVAKATQAPVQDNTIVSPPVLVVETLMEVIDNVKVKQESN
jgi:hypothetical protein